MRMLGKSQSFQNILSQSFWFHYFCKGFLKGKQILFLKLKLWDLLEVCSLIFIFMQCIRQFFVRAVPKTFSWSIRAEEMHGRLQKPANQKAALKQISIADFYIQYDTVCSHLWNYMWASCRAWGHRKYIFSGIVINSDINYFLWE